MQNSSSSIFRLFPSAGIALVTATILLSSCASNEELQNRMDSRNANYQSLQDRREIRQDARDERYDAWFDRIMD